MELHSLEEVNIERTRIFADRKRTNVLRSVEQQLIHNLLRIVPDFITPNIMTGIGVFGSLIVCAAFVVAVNFGSIFLLIGIVGLMINWLGDSLDGRLAYYRKISRKWYGFALDIIMDWLSIVLIGLGFYFYVSDNSKILAFLFVVFYGWSMLIALLRYKIADVYQIDSGIVGPTELRVIISVILIVESFLPGTIIYAAFLITLILLILNVIDTFALLKSGDRRDDGERAKL